MSSVFWMYRVAMITPNNKISSKHRPFYAWQAITLHVQERDVDIVIPDPKDLTDFLKLLIYELKTIDG